MKLFKTIVSVVLAFLVLVSSSSFVIGIHLCAGEIRNVGIFKKAEVCAMESMPPCHQPVKPCCDDQTIVHRADDIKPSLANGPLAAPQGIDILSTIQLIAEIVPSEPISRTSYVRYEPPLRWHDITITNRVFLI